MKVLRSVLACSRNHCCNEKATLLFVCIVEQHVTANVLARYGGHVLLVAIVEKRRSEAIAY
jgi:hypothetical protein